MDKKLNNITGVKFNVYSFNNVYDKENHKSLALQNMETSEVLGVLIRAYRRQQSELKEKVLNMCSGIDALQSILSNNQLEYTLTVECLQRITKDIENLEYMESNPAVPTINMPLHVKDVKKTPFLKTIKDLNKYYDKKLDQPLDILFDETYTISSWSTDILKPLRLVWSCGHGLTDILANNEFASHPIINYKDIISIELMTDNDDGKHTTLCTTYWLCRYVDGSDYPEFKQIELK